MLVLSGPSGVGKTTIAKRLRGVPGITRVMTATTRARRPQEVDGRDYRFLGRAEFEAEIAGGAFLEHAEIDGNLYGTPKAEIERKIAEGALVLVDIDPQGAKSVRGLGLPAFFVFVEPPDMEELKKRLVGRGSEDPDAVRRRLERAEREMKQKDLYDAVVVNRTVEGATDEILALLRGRGLMKG
jgi:guanylate kinase